MGRSICVVTLCIILIPLCLVDLQQRIRNISHTGSLGDILRTSVEFKVLEGVTIGSALPMLVDIVLDKSFNIPNLEIARLSLPQFVSVATASVSPISSDIAFPIKGHSGNQMENANVGFHSSACRTGSIAYGDNTESNRSLQTKRRKSIQIVFVVWLTVVPWRILRKIAE
eukprot:gene35401-47580_t